MPRNKPKKTDRVFDEENIRGAVDDVLTNKVSLRKAGLKWCVNKETLRRYVKLATKCNEEGREFAVKQNYSWHKIFTDEQEEALTQHIIQCAELGYGYTRNQCLALAHEMAVKNNIAVPKNWEENKQASDDWWFGFLKRHKDLSYRKAEACSLSRATSFNRHNVSLFFDNLEKLVDNNLNFQDGSRIFNLDETSCETVQTPTKILARKGVKQVNQNTSAERGTLVTSCFFICANGNSYPPAMVFPRVNFKNVMLTNCVPGTLGLAEKSGWMTGNNFLQVMRHFVRLTNSSPENPSLLIFDNHQSHITIDVINLARASGVTILTIPPHTSHKLQPLDRTVFGPLTLAYSKAVNAWMKKNPGQTVSIYEVASFVNEAYQRSFTRENIASGFRATGIYPVDRDIFSDKDFCQSAATDRPPPNNSAQSGPSPEASSATTSGEATTSDYQQNETPTTSSQPRSTGSIQLPALPIAGPRKGTLRGRKKGRSMIATSTPEKQRIEAEKSKKGKTIVKAPTKKVQKKLPKKNLMRDLIETSSEEEDEHMSVHSDTETSSDEQSSSSGEKHVVGNVRKRIEKRALLGPREFPPLKKKPKKGDYVLVSLISKKSGQAFFVAKVVSEEDEDGDIDVSYLRKSLKYNGKFVVPVAQEICSVSMQDVKLVLPKPSAWGTKRQSSVLSFNVDLSGLKLG